METVKGPDSPEKALERMVDLYQLPFLRLCYAYLHDEELAKDAVQEQGISLLTTKKRAVFSIAYKSCLDIINMSFDAGCGVLHCW